MITVTVGAVKRNAVDDATNYRIYVIEGEGCVLYVGKSKDAIERLASHTCRGAWSQFFGSELDMLLVQPTSNVYTVTLYDEFDVTRLADCPLNIDDQVSMLERKLIYELSPVYNVRGVKSSTLNADKWNILHPPVMASVVTDDLF